MKSRFASLALVSVLLLAIGGRIAWDRSHRLHDTPETKSAFLDNYNPKHVVEPFLANQSFGTFSKEGGGLHSHSIGFGWAFSMPIDKGKSLMYAFDDDVAAQLALNRAQVISHSGDLVRGFRYEYRAGNNTGTVTIRPLSLVPAERKMPLPVGVLDIKTQVDVAETWDDRDPDLFTTGRISPTSRPSLQSSPINDTPSILPISSRLRFPLSRAQKTQYSLAKPESRASVNSNPPRFPSITTGIS
jgi:hypothetical protein